MSYSYPIPSPYFADEAIVRDKAIKLGLGELVQTELEEYCRQAHTMVLGETNKTDWNISDFAYPLLKGAEEDLAAAEAVKGRPLLLDAYKSLVEAAFMKINTVKKNPTISSANAPPATVGITGRSWRTRGMNPLANWYFSLAVDGREGDSESSYGDPGSGSTINSYP